MDDLVQHLSDNVPSNGKQVVVLVDEELPDFHAMIEIAKEVHSSPF